MTPYEIHNRDPRYLTTAELKRWGLAIFLTYSGMGVIIGVITVITLSDWAIVVTVPLGLFFGRVFGFLHWPASKVYWKLQRGNE